MLLGFNQIAMFINSNVLSPKTRETTNQLFILSLCFLHISTIPMATANLSARINSTKKTQKSDVKFSVKKGLKKI